MALTPRETEVPEGRRQNSPPTLRERYVIDPSQELAELSQPSVKAYAVQDKRDPGRPLFALVCKPNLQPRMNALGFLKGENIRGLLPLVDYGIIHWPIFNRRCMVVIYQRPAGGRLIDALKSGKLKLNEHELPRKIIEPIAVALRELAPNDIPHRAIRVENLYLFEEEKQTIVVGDCATTPPGYDQPTSFEPIERAMATPDGRGKGNIGDDLYALGASIVTLILGHNPVAKLSDDQVLAAKVEQGTYATLCGRERVPLHLLEPLRGMLSDEPDERWTLEEVDFWVSGRRMTPMQKKAAKKAESRFSFAGRDHGTVRTLAHAFTCHVNEAARVIRKGQLETWLRRSIKDNDMAEAVAAAVEAARAHERDFQGSDDYLVTKVSIILDPKGPIRYKGLAFIPEAFGTVLATEYMEKGAAPKCAEVLGQDLPGLWVILQPNYTPGHSNIEKLFVQLRSHAANRDLGYGMERCLYEFNPMLPCQSSFISDEYVMDIRQLLPALDQAGNHVDTTLRPLDRHVAAFIAHRLGSDVEPHLRTMADPSPSLQVNGMVSLLAYVQWRLGPESLLGLTSWVGGLLAPSINSYHSRSVRRELERAIPKVIRQGSLPELYNLIENQNKRESDREGFEIAVEEFAEAEADVRTVEHSDGNDATLAEIKGQEAAAMTSIMLTMLSMAVLILIEFL